MKISYRTNPILEVLKTGKWDKMIIPDSKYDIMINFKHHADYYNKNISCLTNTFKDAIEKSFDKLIRDEVFFEYKREFGTILNFMTFPGNIKIDVCYSVWDAGDVEIKKNWIVYYFDRNVLLGCSIQNVKTGFCTPAYVNPFLNLAETIFKSNGIVFEDKSQLITEIDNQLYTRLIATINFIKYAEVETKYLPANKITKDINCKYVNDTKLGINILDSKWFTNLIKSDAFKVHGHFRLQPYGQGLKERKLIWINDFMKTGYTAPARKLAEA